MKIYSEQETKLVNIILKSIFFIQYSIICSVKGQQLSEIEDGITSPQFIDIKDKPLGSVPNILFWNDQQKQFSTQVEKMKHTLLMGDYGTGLCGIVMSSYLMNSL